MDAHQHEQIYHGGMKKSKIFVNNFVGGMGWGFGVTIGLSALIAISTFLLRQINFVPVVGQFASEIVQFVQESGPQRTRK